MSYAVVVRTAMSSFEVEKPTLAQACQVAAQEQIKLEKFPDAHFDGYYDSGTAVRVFDTETNDEIDWRDYNNG